MSLFACFDNHETMQCPAVRSQDEYSVTRVAHSFGNEKTKSNVFLATGGPTPTAQDQPLIAVKMGKWSSWRDSEAFLNEYIIHQSLNHESIVNCFGGDTEYFSLYFEYLAGHTISHYTNKKRMSTFKAHFSDAAVTRVLKNMAEALSYMHNRQENEGQEPGQVVHNDVRRGNIIYSDEQGAILIDVGAARRFVGSEIAKMTGGSPFFLSPDFLSKGMRGKAGDVYALGVTMLFLEGCLPQPVDSMSSYVNRCGTGNQLSPGHVGS